MPLVWVHLGTKAIPKYLKRSLQNVASLFRNVNLVLIVDEEKNLRDLKIDNLKIIKVDYLDCEWTQIKSKIEHDLDFRDGFWFSSLARFKALHSYMIQENVSRLLHIESDVTLLPDFPLQKFQLMGDTLAFPLQGDNQGIASVMFVGDKFTFDLFIRSCEEDMNLNPKNTDMTLLFSFLRKFPDKTNILPTLPNDLVRRDIQSQEYLRISNAYEEFGGIFDAISIGQFLFGIDSRNNRGKKILFREDSSHWVKPRELKFKLVKDSVVVSNSISECKLFCLHIHSKDISAFTFKSLKTEFNYRLNQSIKGEKTEFQYFVFIQAIYKSLLRRAKFVWQIKNEI